MCELRHVYDSTALTHFVYLFKEERENQFVVLKTQRQGWRNRSSEDKLASKAFHLKLLLGAVSTVYVNQRLEMQEPGTDEDIAVSLLGKLLHQQELDAETLLAARDQVVLISVLRGRSFVSRLA